MSKLIKYFCFIIFFTFISMQNTFAQTEEFYGIGAELAQDNFNKKVIIVGIINNTPAQKEGLAIGDEITAIDGKKVRKLNLCEVVSMIRGQENTKVKLRIKKNFFIRKTVELTREKITVDNYHHELFDAHWAQIATPCFINARLFPNEAVKKFSKKHKNTVIALNEYWFKRKQTFQIGFNSCMNYSNKENQELCLIHLLDREAEKTNTDKNLYKFLKD